ncbi:MAG: ATP-binding protein, partial [Duodenibacillus sp.]
GLVDWLKDPKSNQMPEVFALDGKEQEITGRSVPERALSEYARIAPGIDAVTQMLPTNRGRHRHRMLRTQGEGVAVMHLPELGWVRFFAVRTDVPATRFLAALWRTPWWVYLALMLAATSAVAGLMAWRLSKPIRKLNWAMGKVGEGNFKIRIAPEMGRSNDEIVSLARRFDEMTERIEGLVARQKRLFHDVSHEFRSPLARMAVALELTERDPSKLASLTPRLTQEIGNLDALVDELLTYARLDDNSPLKKERAELTGLLQSIVDDADFEGSSRNVHVLLESDGPIWVDAQIDTLLRAVENLIRNALRFTPEGETVRVAVQKQDERITITVTDAGPGIPEEDLKSMFDPFVRGRDQATGSGFGLGLAIARRAVERHGGTLTAANIRPRGLQMRIELPAADDAVSP